jgi:hypothetical protein
VNRPQVFGTQYPGDKAAENTPKPQVDPHVMNIQRTQQPYDVKLLPDSVRRDFCVPDVSQEEKNLAIFNTGHRPEGERPRAPISYWGPRRIDTLATTCTQVLISRLVNWNVNRIVALLDFHLSVERASRHLGALIALTNSRESTATNQASGFLSVPATLSAVAEFNFSSLTQRRREYKKVAR